MSCTSLANTYPGRMKTPPLRHSPARARLVSWFAILVASWTAVQAHAAPVVSNLTAGQRAGTRLVDVGYDVAAPGFPAVFIKLEASSDGGATWTVPVQTVSGDVGDAVPVGAGKAIVWDAGADWPGNLSTQMRFRVTADDGFSLIPGGEFTMGRTSGDTDSNAPPVTVMVSSFYMQKTETTKAQWDTVRAWAVDNGYSDLPEGGGKAANHPVQNVNWRDVVKWCNARSEMENLTPCYTVGGLVMKTGTTVPDVNWSADGYRLPTEAEWEKAARGGVEGARYPWGADTISHAQANYNGSGTSHGNQSIGYHPDYNDSVTPYTSPVGSFAANGYGLHDMAGNILEWCWDWYAPGQYANGVTDPRGPASGTARVLRGGSWGEDDGGAFNARCSFRGDGSPGIRHASRGFRPARSALTSDFAEIPGGTFTMGRTSGDSDGNAPPVTVTVSSFELQVTETTKAGWDAVRAWGLTHGYVDLPTGGGKGADHPVQNVSWWDVVKWCNARSEMEGLTPCYTVGGLVMKTGTTAPNVDWEADGYRLPTEAEWEKAARADFIGKRFPWGGDTITHDNANYSANSSAFSYDASGYTEGTTHPLYDDGITPGTSPAGSFPANRFGLSDMAGNVFEWCWDWHGTDYYTSGVTNPRGPASGTNRALRGGGWNNGANRARCADRHSRVPSDRIHNVGFRPARRTDRIGVSATDSDVTLHIKGDASIQFTSLVQVDDGTPRAVSFTSEPDGLPFQLLYDGQATPPSAPGVYAVSASLDHPNYIGSDSAELTILGLSGKGQRVLSGSTGPQTANGTDYGPVLLGGVSTQTFTLANPGAQPVTLTGAPRVEIVGDHAGDFQVIAQPEAVLEGGGALAFEIRFAPTQPGSRLAAVRVQSADIANGPLTFAIQGFGALPSLLAQTITFSAPASVFAGEGVLNLAASASSGLPVTLTLLSGPATLDGNALTLTGAGVVKVEARQQGGGNFAPAKPVVRSITVRADPASLTLAGLTQTYNGTPRAVTVLGAADAVQVTYRVNGADTDQPPVAAGKYAVTAVAGAVTKKGALTILPAPVIVQPRDQRRWVGEANPNPILTFTGFLGMDDESLLTKPVSVKTTAKPNSPVGAYPVTSSGGAAPNYIFIHRPGTLVVEGFAGRYEALLRDPVSGLPAGRLLVTVPGTSRSGSASLVLGGEVTAVPLAGPLDLDTDGRVADGLFRKTQGGVSFEAEFHLSVFGEMTATARRNGEAVAEAQDGIRLLDAAKGARAPQEGAYTAWLKAARPAAADVPEGDGWATAKLNAAGLLALAGRLGDATPFTASLPVDIQGGFRLFVQPYKPARAGAHLAGQWRLEEHPDKAGAWWLEAAELDWEKSPRDKDSAYRAGFDPVKVDMTLDPWTAPARTQSLGEVLGLTGNDWLVEHGPTGSVTHGTLPARVALTTGHALTVLEPVTSPANARKWKAKITPATGMFSGSFELVEPTQKRTVNFTGVLRQTDDVLLGAGHYLLPPLKGAAGNENRTGILRFWKKE